MVNTTPRPLYPQEIPGTHCTGGWVGPRAGLDVCEKSRPHRDFFLHVHIYSYLVIQWLYNGYTMVIHSRLSHAHNS
jgi:hypothetical protein